MVSVIHLKVIAPQINQHEIPLVDRGRLEHAQHLVARDGHHLRLGSGVCRIPGRCRGCVLSRHFDNLGPCCSYEAGSKTSSERRDTVQGNSHGGEREEGFGACLFVPLRSSSAAARCCHFSPLIGCPGEACRSLPSSFACSTPFSQGSSDGWWDAPPESQSTTYVCTLVVKATSIQVMTVETRSTLGSRHHAIYQDMAPESAQRLRDLMPGSVLLQERRRPSLAAHSRSLRFQNVPAHYQLLAVGCYLVQRYSPYR